MITQENFINVLNLLNFEQHGQIWTKTINNFELKVDFKEKKLSYPNGITYGRETTTNFSQNENFVVFECVHNLLNSGYLPQHIILEPTIPGGHGETSAFGDILIQDNDNKSYLLIECKTTDNKNSEFEKEWKKMLTNGGQLFNYFNTYRSCQHLCLYACDFNNQQVERIYHLISMADNDDYLNNDKNLIGFKTVHENNGGKEAYFKVWKDTYQYDYISHNLFESETFKIGNRPYNIHDLKFVGESTIQKKYHQFATIMRQYNVSGRENAFDKLVNLFLCKVVDEKNNPDNLKVYWKGASSDNHFDLQDRLQKLYKMGMEEFLNEEVTYIEDSQIEEAFKWFKHKKDETRDTILDYFKQLKFYSNNAFAFLDVHNENLFLQNAVILKEVVQMLQDIRLKNEHEQHQFLGDLFEGFLDQGIKQSEGQFFTPMPIVKFLISSLPLNPLIENENVPKVIDYACGAGHFLTEYASQIKELIGLENKDILKSHYANIYGIEKEYRLSKVAKVSAFMYEQDDINIIYADALAKNPKIQNEEFSLLVANPPYSVKGFLSTLNDEDKKDFELYQDLNEETFNSIEVFFIERAKQLLKSGGIGVIILPSSILTNGNVYIKCREIILKYFDLIAIAEFGSGTFGKTGTNTVTLFLRRKTIKPDLAKHYQNRVETWFGGDFDTHIEHIFSDSHLLAKYCQHCGFDFEQYKGFLLGQDFKIFENELFKQYRQEFDASSELKELKKKKYFKELSNDEKNNKLNQSFIEFLKQKESEKVFYYLMALDNKKAVLVIKNPSDNKANKAFLGYEWSSAKGSEGIKYFGGTQHKEGEDDTLEVLKGIYKIQTPLFNPNNLTDKTKINHLIREHFLGNEIVISEQNQPFVSLLPLTQMIDFSRTSFDKAIRTSIQKKVEIESKYPLVKLEYILSSIETGSRPKGGVGFINNGAYSLGGEHIHKDNGRLELKTIKYVPQTFFDNANRGKIQSNDILLCKDGALTGKVALVRDELQNVSAMVNEHVFILRCDNLTQQIFVFNYLYSEYGQILLKNNITGSAQGGLNSTNLKNIKIPLPPLEIQEKIIKECQKIDKEYETSRMAIETYRQKIADIFHELEVVKNAPQGGGKNV